MPSLNPGDVVELQAMMMAWNGMENWEVWSCPIQGFYSNYIPMTDPWD